MMRFTKFYFLGLFLLSLSLSLSFAQNNIYRGCKITNYTTPFGSINNIVGQVGFMLPELQQNRVEAFGNPFMNYTISCPESINVDILSSYTALQMERVDKFWNETKPSQVSTKVFITVTPRGHYGGPYLQAEFDVMNKRISGDSGAYQYKGDYIYPAILDVRMHIFPLYFFSNFYKEDYQWELFDRTYFVALRNSQGLLGGATLFPNIYMDTQPCMIGAYNINVSPTLIDFGNISKNEVDSGKIVTRLFEINIEKKQQSGNCNISSRPKVTFIPQDDYDKDNIHLSNGLMMTFKNEDNSTIPMGKPYLLGSVKNNKLNKKINVQLKKGNRGTPIKAGPFSSTVIYLIEYY